MSEIEDCGRSPAMRLSGTRLPVDATEATALTERRRGMHAAKQGEALLLEPGVLANHDARAGALARAVLFVGPHHRCIVRRD